MSEEQERTLQEQGWLKCFKSLSFSVVSGKRESVLEEQGKLKHFKNLSFVKNIREDPLKLLSGDALSLFEVNRDSSCLF